MQLQGCIAIAPNYLSSLASALIGVPRGREGAHLGEGGAGREDGQGRARARGAGARREGQGQLQGRQREGGRVGSPAVHHLRPARGGPERLGNRPPSEGIGASLHES